MSSSNRERRLLTKRETAELLRLSSRSVDRLVERDVLHPVQLIPRGRLRFPAEELETLIARGR